MISAPPMPKEISIPFCIFMILLGVIMPLFGISLIVVVLIELIFGFTKKGIKPPFKEVNNDSIKYTHNNKNQVLKQ